MKAFQFKRIIAAAAALVISLSTLGSSGVISFATDGGDTEQSAVEEVDMNSYRERLGEIANEQRELDKQIAQAEENIEHQEQVQAKISIRINSLNEEINITTNYINDLDKQIAAQQALVDEKQQEIEQGIEDFKGRLRAMYIAGSDGYTEIILSSNDFYDVLMRTELIKRVADHDKKALDDLVKLKNEYNEQKQLLDSQQAEYKDQLDSLNEKMQYLDELYAKSTALMDESKELKDKLDEQNKILNSEKAEYADKLSEFLKDDYGDSADETGRMKTELAAIMKLREIWAEQAKETAAADDKKDAAQEEDEEQQKGKCLYAFGWPCPSTTLVTSGVGARWGTTHKGLDIGASMGSEIVASEGGTVVIANNTCTHNVPKDGSCGCGGGYGNYVVINHGNGFLTLYGHLTEATVAVGQKVDKGQKIGISGTTGWSTCPHLHFELRYAGNYMNPLSFVTY